MADKLGVVREKMSFTAAFIGNVSFLHIQIMSSEYAEEGLSSVMCHDFGVGLSVGCCVYDFSDTTFYGAVKL